MINPAEQRFVSGYSPRNNQPIVMIADYMWWTDNFVGIGAWMDANLPRGRNHQQGMVLTFDSEQDYLWFMLRWA